MAVRDAEMTPARKGIVDEWAWPFVVNDQLWFTAMCSNSKLAYFALGFLYNEGIIQSAAEVTSIAIGQPPEAVIRVQLDKIVTLPNRRTLTSGCVGGLTFVDIAAKREPVNSTFYISAAKLSAQMLAMKQAVAKIYHSVGGFHTAALSDGEQLLVLATDIGRHNTLDKIAGEALTRGLSTQNRLLLTTGRISSEMLGKAAKMQIPVVATLNSPSHLAVQLAQAWNITLVGYTRGSKMQVYSAWQRLRT
jgi:FdhD protein